MSILASQFPHVLSGHIVAEPRMVLEIEERNPLVRVLLKHFFDDIPAIIRNFPG